MHQQHRATERFWQEYSKLPLAIQQRADKQFAMLRSDPYYPSLHFKRLGTRAGHNLWSARVTLHYRALALEREDGFLWFWIGDHTTYDTLVRAEL